MVTIDVRVGRPHRHYHLPIPIRLVFDPLALVNPAIIPATRTVALVISVLELALIVKTIGLLEDRTTGVH